MRNERQQGQTLVETMVAIIVLVVGITAALGLANFAFKTSTNITKQIIAVGVAREGVEAVKNMRDTNWLQDTLDTTCYDFHTGNNEGSCYRNWRQVPGYYDIRGNSSGKTFSLGYDLVNPAFWTLTPQSSDFTLYYDSTGSDGFYSPSGSIASGYFRKIILTDDTSSPYFDTDLGPRIKVTVQVWWQDKNCPQPSPASFPTSGACRVQVETYLTNWKNY